MKKYVAFFSFLVILILWAGVLMAQIRIVHGTTFPPDPSGNTWFHNSQDHTAHVFEFGKWRTVASDFDSIYACGQVTVLKWPDYYFVFYPGNLLAYMSLDRVWCGESIVLFESIEAVYCLDSKARQLAIIEKEQFKFDIRPFQFQDMDAFCLPQVTEEMPYTSTATMRTWGILGTNGHWLIEPKYDAPFRFLNGFAEVIYYGQKRKINEKGEFVE